MVSGGILRIPQEIGTIEVGEVGSPMWYSWLAEATHCSFHYSHLAGDFTARKERKQRGQHYWVAYRHANSKIYKAYLGKSEVLNEDLLVETSRILARAVEAHSHGGT